MNKNSSAAWLTKWLGLAMLTPLLIGCRTASFSACPPLIEYTPAQQRQVADELRMNKVPATAGMIDDYGRTRNAIRMCQKGK